MVAFMVIVCCLLINDLFLILSAYLMQIYVCGLISSPVFSFFLVFQNIQVRRITRFADIMVFNSFADRTSGLMPMGAVVIFAISRKLKDLLEVMSDFFIFHVKSSEAFDSRSIDDVAVFFVHGEHLGEGSCMHSLVVVSRYFSCFQLLFGKDGID